MKKYRMTFQSNHSKVVVECTEKEYEACYGTVIESSTNGHIVGQTKSGWSWKGNKLWTKEEISDKNTEDLLNFFKEIDVKV